MDGRHLERSIIHRCSKRFGKWQECREMPGNCLGGVYFPTNTVNTPQRVKFCCHSSFRLAVQSHTFRHQEQLCLSTMQRTRRHKTQRRTSAQMRVFHFVWVSEVAFVTRPCVLHCNWSHTLLIILKACGLVRRCAARVKSFISKFSPVYFIVGNTKQQQSWNKSLIPLHLHSLFLLIWSYCALITYTDLIQSNCGLSEGSTEWDLCDQHNCSAWCQPALMTFIRMLSNKIMQCAMKVVCIHFIKDSLFYAVARHVSLTLMPYKYHWYIKLVLHCHIFFFFYHLWACFRHFYIKREWEKRRKDEKGSAGFFFFWRRLMVSSVHFTQGTLCW